MKLPSASYWPRISKCRLSGVKELWTEEESGEWAKRGTAIHGYLADVMSGKSKPLGNVPKEYREDCEAITTAELPVECEKRFVEQAFAYDVPTGQAVAFAADGHRGYSDAEDVVHGTADVVGLMADGGVCILDWKTGHHRVDPAARNWQLRVLAMAACVVYRADHGVLALHYTEDGWTDVAEFDAFDLAAWEAELRQMAGEISPDAPPVVGSHCKGCPAFRRCSAQTAMIRQLATGSNTIASDIQSMLAPETARLAYERLQTVKAALAHVERAIHAYAEEEPIALGEGRYYGPAPGPERIVNHEEVYQLVKQVSPDGAITDQLNTADWKTSKERIQKVFGKNDASKLIEILRQRGAIKKSVTIREYRKGA